MTDVPPLWYPEVRRLLTPVKMAAVDRASTADGVSDVPSGLDGATGTVLGAAAHKSCFGAPERLFDVRGPDLVAKDLLTGLPSVRSLIEEPSPSSDSDSATGRQAGS